MIIKRHYIERCPKIIKTNESDLFVLCHPHGNFNGKLGGYVWKDGVCAGGGPLPGRMVLWFRQSHGFNYSWFPWTAGMKIEYNAGKEPIAFTEEEIDDVPLRERRRRESIARAKRGVYRGKYKTKKSGKK